MKQINDTKNSIEALNSTNSTNHNNLKELYDKKNKNQQTKTIIHFSNDSLTTAIKDADLTYIEKYIGDKLRTKKKVPPKVQGTDVPTILAASHYATSDKHIKIIKAFIDAGLSPDDNYNSVTPIQLAIERAELSTTEFFIEQNINFKQKNRNGKNLLMLALQYLPILSLIDKLVLKGVEINDIDVDEISVVMYVVSTLNLTIVKKFLNYTNIDLYAKDKFGKNVLAFAIDEYCDTPGIICKHCKSFPIVDLLIKKGVPVDDQNLLKIYICNDNKRKNTKIILVSPLYYAIYKGHYLVVKRLLNEKVNVNISFGICLYQAASKGHLLIVKALLEAGAELDSYVPDLGTALIGAVGEQRFEVIEFLLERGARMDVPCPNKKKTLLNIMLYSDNEKISKILLKELIKRDLKSHLSKEKLISNIFDLLIICLHKIRLDGKNKDNTYSIDIKHNKKILKEIIPSEFRQRGYSYLTLPDHVIHKIFIDFLNNPKIITMAEKAADVIKKIEKIKDVKNIDHLLKMLLKEFWKNSKEKTRYEEFENKTQLIKLKRTIMDFQTKTSNLYQQFMKISDDSECILSNAGNNALDSFEKINNEFVKVYKTTSPQIFYLCSLAASVNNISELQGHLVQLDNLFNELENQLNINQKFNQDITKSQEILLAAVVQQNNTECTEKSENSYQKIKTRKLEKTTDILMIADELRQKKIKERAERRLELANFSNTQKNEQCTKISEQKLALEKLIEETNALNEMKKKSDLQYLENSLSDRPISILVQYKGNVDQQLALLNKDSKNDSKNTIEVDIDETLNDVSIKIQISALEKVLKFINTLPDYSLFSVNELYILRYSIMYCLAIVGESLYQQGKHSIFSNHLRNFLFGYSEELFPEIDYKKIDEYINTNKELIAMVQDMIKIAMVEASAAVNDNRYDIKINSNNIASPLYQKIMDHKLSAENRGYDFYLQQISRDEHSLFRINEYKKGGGLFNRNSLILDLAIRFLISRIGKNAKYLQYLNPDIYETLNFFNKRLDAFIKKGREYRHISSLEDCLSNVLCGNNVNSVSSIGINTANPLANDIASVSCNKNTDNKDKNFTL